MIQSSEILVDPLAEEFCLKSYQKANFRVSVLSA